MNNDYKYGMYEQAIVLCESNINYLLKKVTLLTDEIRLETEKLNSYRKLQENLDVED